MQNNNNWTGKWNLIEDDFSTDDVAADVKKYLAEQTLERIRKETEQYIQRIHKGNDGNYFKASANKRGGGFEPIQPGRRTNIKPGSEEKAELLEERLRRGEPLWQDGDRTDFEGAH